MPIDPKHKKNFPSVTVAKTASHASRPLQITSDSGNSCPSTSNAPTYAVRMPIVRILRFRRIAPSLPGRSAKNSRGARRDEADGDDADDDVVPAGPPLPRL